MNEIIKLAEEKLSSQLHILSNMKEGREEAIESLVMSQNEIAEQEVKIKNLRKEISTLYVKFPEYAKDTSAPEAPYPQAIKSSPKPFYGGKAKPKSPFRDEDED